MNVSGSFNGFCWETGGKAIPEMEMTRTKFHAVEDANRDERRYISQGGCSVRVTGIAAFSDSVSIEDILEGNRKERNQSRWFCPICHLGGYPLVHCGDTMTGLCSSE